MLATRVRVSGAALALCLVGLTCAGCSAEPPLQPSFGEQTGRELLAPLRFAWLSSERETAELPSAIALGARAGGRTLLYVEFPPPTQQRPIAQAQLLLRSVGPSSAKVQVELWRADAPRGELRVWGDQPRALYPRVAASLLAEAGPLRLDVTPIVRAAAEPAALVRLLLRAEPGDGEGVLIATGAFGAEAPKLELYFE